MILKLCYPQKNYSTVKAPQIFSNILLSSIWQFSIHWFCRWLSRKPLVQHDKMFWPKFEEFQVLCMVSRCYNNTYLWYNIIEYLGTKLEVQVLILCSKIYVQMFWDNISEFYLYEEKKVWQFCKTFLNTFSL